MLLALILACTIEERVLFDVPITATPAATSWTAADGTAVALSTASVEIADLRLEAPPEAVARFTWPSLIPAAMAHPGHDYPGDVGGELLGTWSVDLTAPAVTLGTASCYGGAYGTGRLHITATPAVLEGQATPPGGAAMPFRFEVVADREVINLPFEHTLDPTSPPAAIDVGISAMAMLSFADWSTPDADADGLLTTADGDLGNAVLFGVASNLSWSLTLPP